jgi:hypothetical protein
VLVTGIQSTHVCVAGKDSFQPKDLGWLDPCDKHRDEERHQYLPGSWGLRRIPAPLMPCLGLVATRFTRLSLLLRRLGGRRAFSEDQ